MKAEDVIQELRRRQGDRTLTALAAEIGVSAPYLVDVYKGRRAPGKKIMEYLGITRDVRVSYRRSE